MPFILKQHAAPQLPPVAAVDTDAAPQAFQPVNYLWQQHQSSLLGVNILKKHVPRNMKKAFAQKTQPTTCVNVRGDGNCFYRVISLAVSGSEVNHNVIRQQLVAYMMTDRINMQLSELYPSFNIASAADSGEWAFDAELFSAAAYLQTDIVIYTAHGWHTYGAQTLGNKIHACSIYVKHCQNHFYFVKNI